MTRTWKVMGMVAFGWRAKVQRLAEQGDVP